MSDEQEPSDDRLAWASRNKTIAMIYLNSTAIRAVDYDPFSGNLDVQFTSGSRWYTHHGVPLSVYLGLINTLSKGRYYRNHIKGRYR